MGANIVDLRGIAMDRLENRLDRLEDTHRSVIAAAYENLSGTNQINRAVLRLLDATTFEGFLQDLQGDVAEILRVDALRLVLETEQPESGESVSKLNPVLCIKPEGFVQEYLTRGRTGNARHVTLRQLQPSDNKLFGEEADWVRSEACLKLDLGQGRLAGMLVLGSEDPHVFGPQHGTDLLDFFAGVLERTMRRLLS